VLLRANRPTMRTIRPHHGIPGNPRNPDSPHPLGIDQNGAGVHFSVLEETFFLHG
jgi:hypothetical protein